MIVIREIDFNHAEPRVSDAPMAGEREARKALAELRVQRAKNFNVVHGIVRRAT